MSACKNRVLLVVWMEVGLEGGMVEAGLCGLREVWSEDDIRRGWCAFSWWDGEVIAMG